MTLTILAVSRSESTLDVSTTAGIIVLVVTAVAIVGMIVFWQATTPRRVTPGPASMELRDETPALVDLLTGDFEVEDDAVPATVVDLAARGWFAIESVGGDRTIIRISNRRPDEALTPYEERVLRHVERHAVDGVMPAAALTLGPEGVSERWFKGFVREVTAHGRGLGLCTRRWDLRHLAVVWTIVAVGYGPAWLAVGFADRSTDPTGWASVGNLLVGISLLVGAVLVWLAQRISRSDAQLDTPAGRDAAAHWLGVRDHYRATGDFDDKPAASVAIWERHLAYATAMGLARTVQREITFETVHDRHAWSRATGSWRRIKVRYQALVPGWGSHPGRLAFEGLVQAAISGFIAGVGWYVAGTDLDVDSLTDPQRRWIGLVGIVIAAIAGSVCLFALTKLVLGVLDLFPRRTIDGEVVRRREFRTGHRLPKPVQWMMWSGTDQHGIRRDHDRRTKLHLAVDDGTDDSIVSNVVRSAIYQAAPQGARVRMTVSPRIGYVSSIDVTQPPRASASSERPTTHPLVDETISKAGTAMSASLGTAIEQLEGATDEQGRPILDQVDDEGVTMRERLAEGQAEIDRLRNDPRIANSPIAGFLDAFLGAGRADDEPDTGG